MINSCYSFSGSDLVMLLQEASNQRMRRTDEAHHFRKIKDKYFPCHPGCDEDHGAVKVERWGLQDDLIMPFPITMQDFIAALPLVHRCNEKVE